MLLLSIHTVLQHEDTLISKEAMNCKFNLVLVYVMLTCSRSCGSSCGSCSYWDCLVHAGEPMVLEGRLQSVTSHDVFMHPSVRVIHSCCHCSAYQTEWACLWMNSHTNWATKMAPSPGQTGSNRQCRGDAIIHPIPKYLKSVSYFKFLLKTHFSLKAFSWFILIISLF